MTAVAATEDAGGAIFLPGAPSASQAVSVRGLRKTYGDMHAVDGIDFDVKPGETFGFLGPNGAGKSTTIKILCTIVPPSGGRALVAGHDVLSEKLQVRRGIGLVFQEQTLDEYLTAEQNLSFHAELYGVPRSQARRRIRAVLGMVGLSDRRKDVVGSFSGGMRRRLELARGLLHSPQVLFLDEPTVGLDPVSRANVWRYVDELREAEGITVFLTTHYLDEAERCDRIAIMNAGRIVALDTPDALKAAVGADRITVTTENNDLTVRELQAGFGVSVEVRDGAVTFSVPDGARFLPQLFSGLSVPITSVTVQRPTLDDVFFQRTGTTISDASRAASPTTGTTTEGG